MKESTSGPDFLRRSALAALVTGVLVGLGVAWHWGWAAGSGFAASLLWGLADFTVLAMILRILTGQGSRNKTALAALVFLKLVGLYGLALLLLWKRWFPLPAFLAGFSWPLFVVLLRALGGLWWGKPRTAP